MTHEEKLFLLGLILSVGMTMTAVVMARLGPAAVNALEAFGV